MEFFESSKEVQECLNSRGFLSSAESSEEDCKEEFDEEFELHQPRPILIDPKVYTIKEIAPTISSYAQTLKQDKEQTLKQDEEQNLKQDEECPLVCDISSVTMSKSKKKKLRKKKQKDSSSTMQFIAETPNRFTVLEPPSNRFTVLEPPSPRFTVLEPPSPRFTVLEPIQSKMKSFEESPCLRIKDIQFQNLTCDKNFPKLPSTYADVNKVVPPYNLSKLKRQNIIFKIILGFAKLETRVLNFITEPKVVHVYQQEFLEQLRDLNVPYVSTYDNFCKVVLSLSQTKFSCTDEQLFLPTELRESCNISQFGSNEDDDFVVSFVRQCFELYTRRFMYLAEYSKYMRPNSCVKNHDFIIKAKTEGLFQSIINTCKNVPYRKHASQKVEDQTQLILVIDDFTRNRKYFYDDTYNGSKFKQFYEAFCGGTIEDLSVIDNGDDISELKEQNAGNAANAKKAKQNVGPQNRNSFDDEENEVINRTINHITNNISSMLKVKHIKDEVLNRLQIEDNLPLKLKDQRIKEIMDEIIEIESEDPTILFGNEDKRYSFNHGMDILRGQLTSIYKDGCKKEVNQNAEIQKCKNLSRKLNGKRGKDDLVKQNVEKISRKSKDKDKSGLVNKNNEKQKPVRKDEVDKDDWSRLNIDMQSHKNALQLLKDKRKQDDLVTQSKNIQNDENVPLSFNDEHVKPPPINQNLDLQNDSVTFDSEDKEELVNQNIEKFSPISKDEDKSLVNKDDLIDIQSLENVSTVLNTIPQKGLVNENFGVQNLAPNLNEEFDGEHKDELVNQNIEKFSPISKDEDESLVNKDDLINQNIEKFSPIKDEDESLVNKDDLISQNIGIQNLENISTVLNTICQKDDLVNENFDLQNLAPNVNEEHKKDNLDEEEILTIEPFFIEKSLIEYPLVWVLNLSKLKLVLLWVFVLLLLKNGILTILYGILSILYCLLLILNYVDLVFFLLLLFYMCILFVSSFNS